MLRSDVTEPQENLGKAARGTRGRAEAGMIETGIMYDR